MTFGSLKQSKLQLCCCEHSKKGTFFEGFKQKTLHTATQISAKNKKSYHFGCGSHLTHFILVFIRIRPNLFEKHVGNFIRNLKEETLSKSDFK
jgi:hypothetical protein